MKNKLILLSTTLILLAIFLGGCATGMTPSSYYGMTADADYVYISGGTNVFAVDLETHAESWRFPVKATVFAAPVLTEDGQLLVGGFDHMLYSLDPEDASENWKFEGARDRYIGSPLVTADAIYAPNADYYLYAVSLDGDALWSYKADQSLWGTPVSDGDYVYFGSLGGTIYALEALTGELAWKIEVEGAILGSPVLNDGHLYFSLYSGSLVALDTRDGDLLWEESLESWVWSGPLLLDDTLYVGDGAGNLYAFSLDGKSIWEKTLVGAIVSHPVLLNDELVVGTDAGNIYYVSLDGRDVRNTTLTGEKPIQVYAPLLPAGTLVLASPTGADFILVALEDDSQSWSFKPEK